MREKSEPAAIQPQKFAVGETVLIKRPHLWASCVGEVVSFANGQHCIKIAGKHGDVFHTDAAAEFLEEWI